MEKSKNKNIIYPPGDAGIWIIIYIELITFGLFFLGYVYSRRQDVELFNSSQLALNQTSGFINTILLITSSYFVIRAVHSIKTYEIKKASIYATRWLNAAIGLGGFFLIIKMSEFVTKYSQGINLSTNKFFMFYFLLTVFHFLHVLLGMIILFNIKEKTKIQGYNKNDLKGMQTGASYWHMVDLLWIVLFPLIYIIR
jgi:nitric oxide reductase NorE protein